MKTTLLKTAYDRNYFVNNKVIYEISPYSVVDDEHVIHIGPNSNTDLIPKLKVTTSEKNKEGQYVTISIDTYYLDSLIEDGDILNEKGFLKTNHMVSPETRDKLYDFYKAFCEKSFGKALADNPGYTYEYIYKNKLTFGLPLFMINYGEENPKIKYTVELFDKQVEESEEPQGVVVDVIQMTEEKYNTLRDEAIKDKILESAKATAKEYDYKVNSVNAEKRQD